MISVRMIGRVSPTWIWALMALLFTVDARPDVIVNQKGRRLEGQVLRESTAGVTLQLDDGTEVILPWQSIQTIERADEWKNMVRVGDHSLEVGDYERARESFETALLANPPAEEIEAIRARITQAMEAMAPGPDPRPHRRGRLPHRAEPVAASHPRAR